LRRRPLRAELVVPVPLAPARLRWRGYNQAALLAEQVAAALGGRLGTDVLERLDRPAQHTLGAAERLDNLRGAIRCRQPGLVRGRRVVLVDDVMTTGATLSSCAEALETAGARQVLGLVFARTL
jgi:ComF family protein